MIITDSLGSPRKDSHLLLYKDTWPCLLAEWYQKEKNYNHFVFTRKALDTSLLNEYTKMKLDLYDNTDVFLHIGIVDCSRRVLSEKALRIIMMVPLLRSIFKKIAHKYHYGLTKAYKIVYTNEKAFEKNLSWFVGEFKESRIWILPILPVGKTLKKKSYGIDHQVKAYNYIIEKVAEKNHNIVFLRSISKFFNFNDQTLYMNDGYHLNKKSHRIIYEYIINKLSKKENEI